MGSSKSYLGVIGGTLGEQGLERVVTRQEETSQVDEELASNVKEDQEKVDSHKAQDGVNLGDGGLTLQVVENGVLGQLSEK